MRVLLPCCLVAIVTAVTAPGVLAQPGRPVPPPRVARPAVVAAAAAAPAGAAPVDRIALAEQKFPGGAPLKTDPELEQLLIRAEQFAADGRYDLAAVLWQKVLDETGDTLFTRDGRMYFGLSAEVERILKETADEALKVYRITADGEAQATLAAGEKGGAAGAKDSEEAALARVVRRYFLSSRGDDAAFKLGCMALDRRDFVGAHRLFTKVLEQHPDPSMPRASVLLRLAVACSRIGDHAAAAAAFAEAEQEFLKDSAGDVGEGLVAEVKKELERAKTSAAASTTSPQDYRMALGGPERRGVMPPLPDELTQSTLRELWALAFPITQSGQATEAKLAHHVHLSGSGAQVVNVAVNADGLISRWRDNGWTPAGQLLFADGKVFIKTNNDLACWDLAAPVERPVWRSTWLNAFQLDPHTQMFTTINQGSGNTKLPTQAHEVQFFGDRVAQSMSIAGGLVLNLEGPRIARHGPARAIAGPNQPQMHGFQYGVTPRRSRKNWLAAYEISTGRARWRRGADETAKNDDTEVGFMAAPVPYGELLLAPVTDGGAIWLHALSASDGAPVWKTYLCDEPSGGCAAWSPVCVSVAGSDAYVLCGAGVVFSVDAASGAIRYAVRYARDGDQNEQLRAMGYGGAVQLNLKGFEDDAAIPFGRALIVMASDHDGLFALDRRTGDILWRTPRTPFDLSVKYCLGVADGGLYVAGSNVVRKYDAAGGKLLWEQPTPEMYGRGALTSNAVYMPVKGQVGTAVLKLDPGSGKVLAQAGVTLTENQADMPLGNLFSDGEKLWALSGHRVSMLADDQYERRTLDRRIETGDGAAMLERARLLLSQGRMEEALRDIDEVYRVQAARREGHLAAPAISAILIDQRLFSSDPHAALLILSRLVDQERRAGRRLDESLALQLRDAALMLTSRESPASVPLLIDAAASLPAHDWPEVARAVNRSAVMEQAPLLREAIGRSPAALAASAEALAKFEGEGAADLLTGQLGHENPWVRLAVARALAGIGKRQSLMALASLLDDSDARISLHADFALRKLTGQDHGIDPFADDAGRAAARKQWSNWIAASGESAELLPLPERPAEAGYTLVCCGAQNVAIEFDRQGKERWRGAVPSTLACQSLPSGGRLFSSQPTPLLIEYNARGEEIWRSPETSLPAVASSVERLPNGNTLIACPISTQSVVELSARGGKAWEHLMTSQPFSARRLAGGAVLVASTTGNDGRVSEISPAGKELWAVAGLPGVLKASRLPSGNLLVVQHGQNRVSEIDSEGKPVWALNALNTPTDAVRLSSGHTLIVDANRLLEVDALGVVVSERPIPGAVGVSTN